MRKKETKKKERKRKLGNQTAFLKQLQLGRQFHIKEIHKRTLESIKLKNSPLALWICKQ